MVEHKFRVAICGGGIGGVSLAVALSHYPEIKVDIFEAARNFREIGVGISVWKRSIELFKKLGCEEHVNKVVTYPPKETANLAFHFRKADQPVGEQFHTWMIEGGMNALHRGQFLDALVQSMPPSCTTHFSKRCVSYSQRPDGPVGLAFNDGTTAECDVLLACDGINSVLRAQMYREEIQKTSDKSLERYIDPMWSGRVVYRISIPSDRLREINPTHRVLTTPNMYCGKNKHILVYPIVGGTRISAAAYNCMPHLEGTNLSDAPLPERSLQDLNNQYKGWEKEVQDILEAVDDLPMRWPVLSLDPLPFYVRDRVALSGDAAHATTPHQGSGAGLSIEDAYVIARLLGHPSTTKSNIRNSLLAYEAIRLPRTHDVMIGSRMNGHNFEFNGEHGDDLKMIGESIAEITAWVADLDPEVDVEAALAKMEGLNRGVKAVEL